MTLAEQRARARHLLEQAEERLDAGSQDSAFIVACALERLAEVWAADGRRLCPRCATRRVSPGRDFCTFCAEQIATQLLHKRTWWERHGNTWRAARQAAAGGGESGSGSRSGSAP